MYFGNWKVLVAMKCRVIKNLTSNISFLWFISLALFGMYFTQHFIYWHHLLINPYNASISNVIWQLALHYYSHYTTTITSLFASSSSNLHKILVDMYYYFAVLENFSHGVWIIVYHKFTS